MIDLKIKELRLVVTNECSYSCRYCNLYYKKLFQLNLITKEDLIDWYKIGNESYSLLYESACDNAVLNISDYDFLLSVLRDRFALEDITFSGGDPFLNKEIKSLINLAASKGLRTTAITKGAPLFNIKNTSSAYKKIGNLSRVIFSIDTLNPREYAKNNLPILKYTAALGYLPKTLNVIKILSKAGYNIEVNSVVSPCKSQSDWLKSFANTKKIILFCLKNGISKVKFIELDSMKTLGKPYIEKYFRAMKRAGFFTKNVSKMKVMAYRTHCPETFITGGKEKKCEFSSGGELHLDFSGKSFLCQKDEKFKFIDISSSVKNRDESALIKDLIKIDKEIKKQKCKFSYVKKN